jgi:hypothetical protein
MSLINSQDHMAPQHDPDSEETQDMQRGGSGAASALERMKADHALRHKRQHGARTSGPGHEDDRTPER